ncbi:MAG TPA: UDP-N-acetylmuramoyl-L-alanyl-D-glutamate--2,6-diaminopimelate ligase [Candidatus Dormibacteraeota bacterium]|nr:UDP-N-acetylmuramoyl-L-alanyl-D-glutamate--2,6-diaminopimelate ligase [Candidatus Dormibacteraeota bacterium]
MTTLEALLRNSGLPAVSGADIAVSGVDYDSRTTVAGSVFVAIPGAHSDGHSHAREAVERGAVAVVAEHVPAPSIPAGIPLVIVADSRAALAPLAAEIAGHPSRRLCIAGITGTDGKTTTTTMLHAAWRACGLRAGAMSTVDFRVDDSVTINDTRQTTPEAVDLQRRLRTLVDAGCTHAAVETSSHALALHRVDCVDFRAAVFTRITSEHLDVHGTQAEYLEAKARLGHAVSARHDGIMVLDADDEIGYPRLSTIAVAQRLTYSASAAAGADLCAESVTADAGGVRFTALTPWGRTAVQLRLAGRFNVANALAAVAAACATGGNLEGAVRGLGDLDHVSGRMERVDLGQPFSVVIDYAHTADSLERVLSELRAATPGRLWVVFGSAGERDRPKRAEMGAIAARLADVVVVTDEDPREEDREAILEEIAAAARAHGARDSDSLHVIPDREAAIDFAIQGAAAGDTVLCAGKGHESSIISGRCKLPWSEHDTVERAVARRLHGNPPPA